MQPQLDTLRVVRVHARQRPRRVSPLHILQTDGAPHVRRRVVAHRARTLERARLHANGRFARIRPDHGAPPARNHPREREVDALRHDRRVVHDREAAQGDGDHYRQKEHVDGGQEEENHAERQEERAGVQEDARRPVRDAHRALRASRPSPTTGCAPQAVSDRAS